VSARAEPLHEHLLALRGQLGKGQVAQVFDAVAERPALHVGTGQMPPVLEPVALDDLCHRHASWGGVAEFGMRDGEAMECEFGLLRVSSAERVALDLSASLIVATGVVSAVRSAPEEPALHRSSSSLMNRLISDSGIKNGRLCFSARNLP
jgi:hypothetical protein